MDIKDILARCDHTLLRTDCTAAEIRALCDDAIRFGCASVCIPPAHVAGAKRYVNGQMKICTVIGFPNGYNTAAAKVFETEDAVKNGADYLGVGAVFPTGSKDDAAEVDYATLKAICNAVSIPVIAIGGITCENVTQLRGSGICGVAVISAIYAKEDIAAAARELRLAVEGTVAE